MKKDHFSHSVVYPYKKRIMTDNDFELLNSSTAWLNDTLSVYSMKPVSIENRTV